MHKFLKIATLGRQKHPNGFSLVELMVVLVIAGILAIGVVMSFTNPIAKVKAVAFEMRGDINYARAVSVKENQSVLVYFILGAEDGYRICFDLDDSGDCDPANDEIIKEVTFRKEVQFYDFSTIALPADGPTVTPAYDSELAGKSLINEDGIILAGNAIEMRSDGTSDQDGAVIIYFPANSTSTEGRRTIRGKPYAAVIDSASTGRVKLSRWRPEVDDDVGTPYDDRWSKK
jgi:general secretion pathway protein H